MPSLRNRAGLLLDAILVALGLLTGLAIALSNAPAASTVVVFKFMLTLTAVVAAGVTAWTAFLVRGAPRLAWSMLALGLSGFAAGVAMRAWDALYAREAAFPFGADMVRLLLPLGTCAALLLLPVGLDRMSRLRLLLDGLVVAGSFVIVAWTGVLEGIYRTRVGDRVALATSMAYPMLDAVAVTMAMLLFLRALPGQRLTLGLILLAILGIALTNDFVVYFIAAQKYSAHRSVAVGWLAALLLSSAAVAGRSCVYRATPVVQPPSRAAVFLPFVPVAAAIVVTFTSAPKDVLAVPTAVAGALLIAAFIARQLIVANENGRLFAAVVDQALRDPLTGLANRAVFHDRVAHAMQMRQRDGMSVGVMALDIDDFKMVNDTLGHHVGDELLTLIGDRIATSLRTGDTVARVGGDEFAVLIEGREDNSQVVAHRVAEAFERPFDLRGNELIIRPSLGLAVADQDDTEVTAAELLKRADIALDAAKTSRLAGVHNFTTEMEAEFFADGVLHPPPANPVGGRASTVRLLGDLRRAVDQRQLTLLYQPKVDLQTLEIVAVEALVRWPHPDHGVIGPDAFMPLVRRHGLMGAVTDQVVNQALDDASVWHAAGHPVPVAVNVSAPSLATMRLAATVNEALRNRDLSASSVIVEITEDLFLEGLEQTKVVLRELRGYGVRIAVDDFGSGYSALSYLRDLPVDQVKLDRRFVAPITSDPRAAVVVRAVINLAHDLGLTTVAEGIENVDTLAKLREYRCDIGQGYHFSPPVEADRLLAMIANPPWGPTSARSS